MTAPGPSGVPARDGPSPRATAAFAAFVAVLFTWPALPRMGSALLGDPFGELDNHFWMSAFGARNAPVRNLPGGFDLPLMDPVHLLAWVPGSVFGPVFAYNLAIFGDLALAAAGGWALARELGASRAGALVGMVATMASPFLAGMIEFGITESWPVGWLALHAALLLRFGRTGAWGALVGACAALGAFFLSGWYHVAFGLVAEVGLWAWVLVRRKRAGAGPGFVATVAALGAQVGIAALPLVPLWTATQAKREIWAPRVSGLTRPEVYANWDGNPRFGTDLLDLLLPHAHALPMARSAYVGLVVLGLALVGLAPWRRSNAGLAAFALAVPLCVLTLGHWLRVGGNPVPGLGPLPAGWLVGTFPAARAISHWYRAAGPASVFLAAAAAVGASRLSARSAWVAWVLAALVLADSLAFSAVSWPRVTFTPDTPSALLTLPKPGALLQLPFDEGRGLEHTSSKRPYDLWQVFHGRGITEHYEGRDTLLYTNTTVANWQRDCATRAPIVPAVRTPAEDVAALRDLGIAYVVVHPAYAKAKCGTAVGRLLGAPIVRSEEAVVWDVSAE